MITVYHKNVYSVFLICILCLILRVNAIEVATKIPPKVQAILDKANVSSVRQLLNNTRRIIHGNEASRPYMVYLKLPTTNARYKDYARWLCGGVIVHEEYILTSAACIEDVKHFYIVSGTDKYSPEDDKYTNPCIRNGAKKAVWKCIPRNYVFDGHENDNIRWMNNDIAVVKVEEEFDFTRRVRGCDFIPKPICYNNQSAQLESPGTDGTIAGWGSQERYNDWVNSRKQSEVQCLMEADVTILDKRPCKKRWGERYHNIIENYMICTKDMASEISEICREKYVDCTDIGDEDDDDMRRMINEPGPLQLHSAFHNTSGRRQQEVGGGFCENDHGGPLVVGTGITSVVIGIISACLVKEKTNKCYGPFLYTSVFKNRVLINCAIYKDVGGNCNKLFRAGESHTEVEMSWIDHPDGPAKNEIKMRRMKEDEEKLKKAGFSNATTMVSDVVPSAPKFLVLEGSSGNSSVRTDKILQHEGFIVRDVPPKTTTVAKENKTLA